MEIAFGLLIAGFCILFASWIYLIQINDNLFSKVVFITTLAWLYFTYTIFIKLFIESLKKSTYLFDSLLTQWSIVTILLVIACLVITICVFYTNKNSA